MGQGRDDIDVPHDVLRAIRDFAASNAVERVVLFGSRARGTNHVKSDIDLAVWGGDFRSFAFDVDEKAPTLLKFDFVDATRGMSDALRVEIERDGVTVYETVR
jgi:predicted nucleotidyltransferase